MLPLFNRRKFLIAAALSPMFLSCSADESCFLANTADMQPISPEELDLIANPLSRPAYFARVGLPGDGPLIVRHRVFGNDRGLLTDQRIENVRFVQCRFTGLQGYGNDLTNVIFEECQFLGGNFTGEHWRNVRLVRCVARGSFGIAGRYGDVTCEDCSFRGMSQEESKLGHWSDHFGLVGSFESSTFIRCTLENIAARGNKLLRIEDSTTSEIEANLSSDMGVLILKNCRGSKGMLDFSGGNTFSVIQITDSQLDTVKFVGVRGDTLDVAGSTLNLFLGGTQFKKASLKNSALGSGAALRGGVENIGELLIERCTFNGRNASLRLCGQPSVAPEPDKDPIAWSRYRTLTLRHTEVPKAELAYLKVGTLTLDHASLNDTDLSHSRIGTLRLQNATLNGALDLRNTTIRHIDNQGLNNRAAVTGSLESAPQAPEPDVTGAEESSASTAS